MSKTYEVRIKGFHGQAIRFVDHSKQDHIAVQSGHDFFVSAGFADDLEFGAYVNRKKFLRKIAKFFNVAIYEVGAGTYVEGKPTNYIVFDSEDVGYHA